MNASRRSRRGVWAGLLLVVVLAAPAYAWWSYGTELTPDSWNEDVVVALVLPDENGVALPRVIWRGSVRSTAPGTSSSELAHLDPLAPAQVPDTSYGFLRDTYSFGGGRGLARAGAPDAISPAFLILGPEAWVELTAGGRVALDIPSQIDVYDGTRLLTFPVGTSLLSGEEVSALLNGADYLEANERAAIREQLAAYIFDSVSNHPGVPEHAETNLTSQRYERWRGALAAGTW